jgi:hypothetical protein
VELSRSEAVGILPNNLATVGVMMKRVLGASFLVLVVMQLAKAQNNDKSTAKEFETMHFCDRF